MTFSLAAGLWDGPQPAAITAQHSTHTATRMALIEEPP